MGSRRNIEINLDLESKEAQRRVKDLAREIGSLDDDMGDVETAGKQMARALDQATNDMITEIEKTKRAVDALELAFDGFDADPQQVVGDLKKMGLSAEEIEADADELAAALRRIDDVRVSADKAGFSDLNKVMGETRDTGKASSAAIGGIGGAVSELPGIGSLGPIAESIGQLTEGALEGEVSLRQMGGALAVMGGTAVALLVVNKAMDSIAATKAFNEKQAESFADAIKEVGAGVDAVNRSLDGTAEIVGRAGGMFGAFEEEIDIAPTLIKAGVSYDAWLAAVAKGGPELDAVTEALKTHRTGLEEARNAAQITGDVTVEYEQQISATNNAIEIAGETHRNYSGELAKTTAHEEWRAESTLDSAAASEEAARAVEAATEAVEESSAALEENITRLQDQLDAQLGATDAVYALEQAQFDLADAVTDTTETFGTAEGGSREYREAELAVIEASNGVAEAQVRVATELAAANGETLTATQRTDAMNTSLLGQAATLNGPAREAIVAHIANINGVPASQMTAINAAIAAGDIPEAERLLAEASRTRSTSMRVDVDTDSFNTAQRRLDLLERPLSTPLAVNSAVRFRQFATGTQHAPGGAAVVGEEGPEIVELPGGAKVHNATDTARQLSGGRAGNTTIMHFPVGITPDQVARATRLYDRRNS